MLQLIIICSGFESLI